MTAPCGLACFACAFYKDNIADDLAHQTAETIGIEAKDVPCEGCRSERGCSFENALTGNDGCLTRRCVEKEKREKRGQANYSHSGCE